MYNTAEIIYVGSLDNITANAGGFKNRKSLRMLEYL